MVIKPVTGLKKSGSPYSGSQHDGSVLLKNTLLLLFIAGDSKPMDIETSL